MRITSKYIMVMAVMIMVSMAHSAPSYAANRSWDDAAGDWSYAPNWSNDTEPTSSDTAIINNSGIAQVTASGEVASYLYIGQNANTTGSLVMTAGDLTVSSNEYVGNLGKGVFTQSGGANKAAGLYIAFDAGSSGTYTQSGGAVSVSLEFSIGHSSGATGSYTLSGSGVLDSDNKVEHIGYRGKGTFIQSGGTNKLGSLAVGSNTGSSGIYLQSAGFVSIGSNLYVGNVAGSAGYYELSGAGFLNATGVNEYIGNSGKGTLTQTGGTNSVWTLYLAQNSGSSGTYNLQGGYLSAGSILKGSGSSAFNMSGGELKIPSLSAGTINFTGGELHVGTYTGSLDVPNGGVVAPGSSPGAWTQNGAITFEQGSLLEIEIGGTGQGSTYDWLDVNGGNILFNSGSRIMVSWWDSYLAPLGTSFDIITWDSGYTFTNNGFAFEYPDTAKFTYVIDNTNRKLTVTYSQSIPEPATAIGMIGGLFIIGFRRTFRIREKKRTK